MSIEDVQIPVTVREAIELYSDTVKSIDWHSLSMHTQNELLRLAKVLHNLSISQLKALQEELDDSNYKASNLSTDTLREKISISILFAFLMYAFRPGKFRNVALGGSLAGGALAGLAAVQPHVGGFIWTIGALASWKGARDVYQALNQPHDIKYGQIEKFLSNDQLTAPQTKRDKEEYEKIKTYCRAYDESKEKCELQQDCKWYEPLNSGQKGICKPSNLKRIRTKHT